MLGEPGTEQFEIKTYVDNKIIGEQLIHDPFIYNKTVVGFGRLELLKAALKGGLRIEILVQVSATDGMQRAIMSLDPKKTAAETERILADRAEARRAFAESGLVVESENQAMPR